MAGNGKAFAKLDDIIRRLDRIASGDFHKQAVNQIADVMYGLAEESISAGKNPRNVAWKPLAPGSKNFGSKPLPGASAALRRAVNAALAKVVVEYPHAKAHQGGAKRVSIKGSRKSLSGKAIKAMSAEERKGLDRSWKLPARSFLPKQGRLPPAWRDAINAKMLALFGAVWRT